MAMATGNHLIIQDADLEYDPQDYLPMMAALLEGRGDVIYGQAGRACLLGPDESGRDEDDGGDASAAHHAEPQPSRPTACA